MDCDSPRWFYEFCFVTVLVKKIGRIPLVKCIELEYQHVETCRVNKVVEIWKGCAFLFPLLSQCHGSVYPVLRSHSWLTNGR
jgi:hypothetical protein